jgi:hypothetical protein
MSIKEFFKRVFIDLFGILPTPGTTPGVLPSKVEITKASFGAINIGLIVAGLLPMIEQAANLITGNPEILDRLAGPWAPWIAAAAVFVLQLFRLARQDGRNYLLSRSYADRV